MTASLNRSAKTCLLLGLTAALLSGCYFGSPTARGYNEPSTPPLTKAPAQAPAYYGQGERSALPPPPSTSIPAQYADWLFDGQEGRGFAYYLAEGYRRYAKHEDNANDFEDAAKFIHRANAVERGEPIEPEQLSMRILPQYAVNDLLYARQRLMRALNQGARERLPKIAAAAQVSFDCWMEQQEENIQPHDVARCRSDFEAHIVRLEGPKTKEACGPTSSRCTTTPSCPPAPAPAAAPTCTPQQFLIHFDLDKAEPNAAGHTSLKELLTLAANAPGSNLVLNAHADRSGSDAYNEKLSKRRLDAISAALTAGGIPTERITVARFYGETQPRVPTADGVREAANRRVEVRLLCGEAANTCPTNTCATTGACR